MRMNRWSWIYSCFINVCFIKNSFCTLLSISQFLLENKQLETGEHDSWSLVLRGDLISSKRLNLIKMFQISRRTHGGSLQLLLMFLNTVWWVILKCSGLCLQWAGLNNVTFSLAWSSCIFLYVHICVYILLYHILRKNK